MATRSLALAVLTLLFCAAGLAQEAEPFRVIPAADIYAAMRGRKVYQWTNPGLREAIAKSISSSAPPGEIARASGRIETLPSTERRAVLLEALGADNLSSFVVTTPQTTLAPYEVEHDAYRFAFIASQRISLGCSVLLLDDIVEHRIITSSPDTLEGYLVVETPKAMRMRCPYVARRENGSWLVRQLAIARKESSRTQDGLAVIKESVKKRTQGIR